MMSPIDKTPGRNEGERRRDDALRKAKAANPRLTLRVQRAFLLRLLKVGTATADELYDDIEFPPNSKGSGAPIRGLASRKLIRKTGLRVTNCRPCAHGRDLPQWELVDRAKAEAWLAEHPEPPTDDDPQRRLFPEGPKPPENKPGATVPAAAPEESTDPEAQQRGEP